MDKNAPPPPGFMPPPPYTSHVPPQPGVVIIQTQTFGPDTMPMTCPFCHATISTRVMQESGTKTHMFALILCLIGCWPCAPFPYCIDSCLIKKHYCPACNAFLGQYDS
ncbi:lipopolysaccharide-induced tumor necrosis factor-alpha factor homolog [Orussus abietinus]|uniref:lipopolysaccharide-induced tumor necrosis factor-alpha factor homolog n=1 Tax=Orussus abietinus TaxID=222816 RepID=UPI000626ACBC|nr:lipopolysaccharide-induced tumor necrosis factor-alpha factor homolog [Orussus abietinus]XP_012279490.1 lipopolysaccharide-induced tumor necrosis factor-alpha factor homolog [Orussus abietinus]XP_012279491.1 lipopolysaccharide-induced tumor necrosis factor-alpha factor homolog [Orussus abietinus]XP_012279492.1 lipopolysaccharide-induced tumor necrosis factor-alpha factor homolog [Orussus abietinus]XP_012279493.1 lipopolysaccharide-induced tumor necrosis factor-alpha factor homolog [Orussus a